MTGTIAFCVCFFLASKYASCMLEFQIAVCSQSICSQNPSIVVKVICFVNSFLTVVHLNFPFICYFF
jgi:hypothetical protein